MPRHPNKIKTVYLNLGIREDFKAKLDSLLAPPGEKPPLGSYKDLFESLLSDYFVKKGLLP